MTSPCDAHAPVAHPAMCPFLLPAAGAHAGGKQLVTLRWLLKDRRVGHSKFEKLTRVTRTLHIHLCTGKGNKSGTFACGTSTGVLLCTDKVKKEEEMSKRGTILGTDLVMCTGTGTASNPACCLSPNCISTRAPGTLRLARMMKIG